MLQKNQYPPEFYMPIIRATIEKIRCGMKKTRETEKGDVQENRVFVMQYRGNASDVLAKQLKSFQVHSIFTTLKMKDFLPSLKCEVPLVLKSRVVYELTCPGCKSRYVGQTVRHLTTRLNEHRKEPSAMFEHMRGCCPDEQFLFKVIDTTRDATKLLTLEAVHIEKRKPELNRREEYRTRELTIRI